MNSIDEIIEIYKRDFDVTMVDASLMQNVDEHLQGLDEMEKLVHHVRKEGDLRMTQFSEILHVLEQAGIEFIVVGGLAATVHGSVRYTQDVDLVYARGTDNLDRLVWALAGHEPSLRGAAPGLPFRFDLETVQAGLNFRLTTDLGWVDLLGEITGGGKYEDLLAHAVPMKLYGIPCLVLDLETLIRTKRAAGRPRDFDAIAELELLRDRRPKT